MKKYVRTSNNIASKIQNETVMVDVDRGDYYSFNQVGTAIWEIIETPISIDKIIDNLMGEYDIDEKTCRAEVQLFLNELIAMDLAKEEE